MSKIGDLWFALRGEGKQLQVDVRKEGDKAGDSFGKRMAAGFKKSWSGANIGKGLVQGLGLAGGLGAVGLLTTAIGKITDVLGDATTAAIAEEASIQKLGTALKANVPNWDGQTDAIEKVLKARMALGFSDDEQRDSLARIVVATKDVTRALEVQRTAMDLARLKNISLADASDALIKVEGGQFRALKALGIQLPKNATATEALAAVQKAANGQAEDYADTNAGKLLSSQVELGEALEELGKTTMPIVTAAMVLMADAATNVVAAWDVATGKAKAMTPEIEQLAFAINLATKGIELETLPFRTLIGIWQNFIGVIDQALQILTPWDETMDKARRANERFADGSIDDVERLRGAATDDLKGVSTAMDKVGDASGEMADDIETDTEKATKSWDDFRKALIASANDIIDEVFDPIINADRLAAVQAELAAQRRILASEKSTKAEKRDARDKIHELSKDNAEYLLKLAEAGQTGSAAYARGIKELKTAIKNAKGPAKIALQEILDKIREVERAGKEVPINIKVATNVGGALGNALKGLFKAEGGPVQAGRPYIVGERGPELHVPAQSGRILTAAQSVAAVSGGGSGGTNVNLTLYGRPLEVESPADVVREMRRATRLGLPPTRSQPRFKS